MEVIVPPLEESEDESEFEDELMLENDDDRSDTWSRITLLDNEEPLSTPLPSSVPSPPRWRVWNSLFGSSSRAASESQYVIPAVRSRVRGFAEPDCAQQPINHCQPDFMHMDVLGASMLADDFFDASPR